MRHGMINEYLRANTFKCPGCGSEIVFKKDDLICKYCRTPFEVARDCFARVYLVVMRGPFMKDRYKDVACIPYDGVAND
jgi:predicted RNA-binding Zn-ribbon protein involved in translation (DUF1610 family)